MALKLNEERIAEAMARAEKVACAPGGSGRRFALPDPIDEARKMCTRKGRCLFGCIVANSGRDSWDVSLDLHTGEGRLQRQAQCGARVDEGDINL